MLDILRLEILYVGVSIVIGIIIFFESITLKKNGGKLPQSLWFNVGSLLDTLWFFVSLIALYFLDFPKFAIVVPVAYTIYTVFGWGYGTYLMREKGIPDDPKDLIIPQAYNDYSRSFALVFCLFSVAVLMRLLWQS